MELPLCPAYTMKTRKLERNIDTLIENGLYQYIQPNPDILNIEPNTLVTYVTLAEIYGIPLVINKSKEEGHTINKQYLNSSREELEEKYGISRDVIQKVEAKVERKRDRKIKNVELYNKIYHILEEQADICLEQYKKDEVSYTKNDKIVSKQRLIRETYLDLEEAYDKKGKIAIKEFKANEKLDKKLDSLTKKKSGELKKNLIPEQAPKKEIIIEKGE